MTLTPISRRALLRVLGATALSAVATPACFFGGTTPAKPAEPAAAAGAAAQGHGEIAKLWAESGGDDLLKGKTFQGLFNALPNHQRAFELKDTYLRCIDEGCPGGVHMAGSGVLNPNWELDLKGKVAGVYSHEGCGAVGLFIAAAKIKTDDPNAVGDAEAKKVAEKLGVPYLGRIPFKEMTRPAATHTARAIYYDGTGHMDSAQLPGLPQGFMVSRKIFSDPAQAKAEVDVAIGIANGEHGFGELFTGRSPLYVVAVSGLDQDSVPLATMVNELKEVAGKMDNVEIHTLIAKPEAAGDPAKTVAKAANPAAAPPKSAVKAGAAESAAAPAGGHAPAGGAPAGGASAGPLVVPSAPLTPSFGPTLAIQNKIVNLADPGGTRFLRFSAHVEFMPVDQKHGSAARNLLALYEPAPDATTDQPIAEGKADPQKEFLARIKKYSPAIEDVLVQTLSSRTAKELNTPEGKDGVKREVVARIQRLVGDAERVTNVYFTEFVVQ